MDLPSFSFGPLKGTNNPIRTVDDFVSGTIGGRTLGSAKVRDGFCLVK